MLVRHLLELPDLTRSPQDPAFNGRAIQWLASVEETLLKLRHPSAGLVATQRLRLLAAKDGYREPGIYAEGVNRRRIEQVATAFSLGEVAALMQKLVGENDSNIESLREKMIQLLAVASAAKPLPMQGVLSRDEWLREVWKMAGQCLEGRGMFNYLSAAATHQDIAAILDGVMSNLLENAPIQ